jgi:hypothetical protein
MDNFFPEKWTRTPSVVKKEQKQFKIQDGNKIQNGGKIPMA